VRRCRAARLVLHWRYKRQKRNDGGTEIVEIPGRGHALTIDNGWRKVADTALTFVRRSAPSTKASS
jgi:hypothetical protein